MKTGWTVAGIAVVLAAGAAFAAGRHGFMKDRIDARVAAMEDLIEATPDQRKVIDGAKADIVKAFQEQAALRKDHGRMIDLLAADQVDEAKLYALADERAAQIQKMAKVIVPELVKVHDVLTPAQRQKLADHMKQQRARWGPGGFGGRPE